MSEYSNQSYLQALVIVGDSYQIASIRFDNWFNVALMFFPEISVFELKKPYNSNNHGLLSLWD